MKTTTAILALMLTFAPLAVKAQDAKQLVTEMIEAVGGKKNFYRLKNVNYDYEYKNGILPLTLIANETYVFNGELSYADYNAHTMTAPGGEKVVEGFDGSNAWVTINGNLSDNEQANNFSRFIRKTNYYWFSMFFKLLDDGITYKHMGSKKVNGKDYNLVQISYGENVGDAQDTYILYINKETKRVDQFLFTVMGFGIAEPSLMVMEYETVDGIAIPSKRKYIKADWDGNVKGEEWITTSWTNIKFNQEVDKSIFNKPE